MSRHGTRTRADDDVRLLLPHGYAVERKSVGEGSYAVVKPAQHPRYGHVAIKIVDKSQHAPKDFLKKFFPRELEILKRLDHRNIVRVHEIFEIEQKTFIVMELASNGDLLEFIKPKRYLPEYQAKFFFRQLVEACTYLHTRNIIHRDLKCENILLDTHYNIKVTDFGFARVLAPDESSSTFCGSAAYAAPEILRGETYSGFAYDMWSLGVILYIMICGKMPFDDDDIQRQQAEQLARNIQYPSRLKASVDLKTVIGRLLEPEINQRYNCDSVLTAKWLKHMPYLFLNNNDESKHMLDGHLSKLNRGESRSVSDEPEDADTHTGQQKGSFSRRLEKLANIFRGSDRKKSTKKKSPETPSANIKTI